MKTEGLVKRFDIYFPTKKNKNTRELRNYIKEYFNLISVIPRAYLPRIFVLKWKKTNRLATSISWINAMPLTFPPTDYILFCEECDTPWVVQMLGYASTRNTIRKLSPHLDYVDGFDLVKKLPVLYESSGKINNLIRSIVKPMFDRKDVVIVDIIPGFQEEIMYYDKHKPTIKP